MAVSGHIDEFIETKCIAQPLIDHQRAIIDQIISCYDVQRGHFALQPFPKITVVDYLTRDNNRLIP